MVSDTSTTTTTRTWDYAAYGLRLRSELPLPGLPDIPPSAAPDVTVCLAEFDEESLNTVDQGGLWKTGRGIFHLAVDDVASFLVRDGSEISIRVLGEATERDIATYLLGSVMGALIYQRGLWPLHASAVETEKGAVLFAGRSGAGKSTLAAGLHERGFTVLSDDISAIHVHDDRATVVPAIPRMKLNPDTADHLGVDVNDVYRDHARGKYWRATERFSGKETEIARVVFMGLTDSAKPKLSDVSGTEAVSLLSKATYRRKFMKGLGLYDLHFPRLTAFSSLVPMTLLERPTELSGLAATVDQVQDLMS